MWLLPSYMFSSFYRIPASGQHEKPLPPVKPSIPRHVSYFCVPIDLIMRYLDTDVSTENIRIISNWLQNLFVYACVVVPSRLLRHKDSPLRHQPQTLHETSALDHTFMLNSCVSFKTSHLLHIKILFH